MDILASLHFKLWALAATILFLKSNGLALVQGYARSNGAQPQVEEDKGLLSKGAPNVKAEDLMRRASSAWRNDLENIPPFLFLAFGCLTTGITVPLYALLLGVFIVARIAHTVTYLKGLQPYRTLSYCLGALVCLLMAVLILMDFMKVVF